MSKPLILGLSASLRNARSKSGALKAREEIARLADREALDAYLAEQANIHLDQFQDAGRRDGKPFDELYRNLQKSGGQRGLSNSEIALVAALWGAAERGADVSYIPLPDHFPANGEPQDLDTLKGRLHEADGILLSTPVYFGDRSSLAQRFVDMIRTDPELQELLAGKLYAGIAVGAKRNGGQETTLIYSMMDMINLGFLGVGNDSDTTSQYGGTGHAGDIGTMPKDEYGINTAIGTGRRIANVAVQIRAADDAALDDLLRTDFWVLQDRKATATEFVAPYRKEFEDQMHTRILDFAETTIRPCIACDICPIHVGPDKEYRCIIKRRDDGLVEHHEELLWGDVIVPTVYSPRDRRDLETVYQEFMERTRYLRRGDYVFTDRLIVPLVVSEVGANEIMDVRMMTSFVRHHTVMMKPIVAVVHEGRVLNPDDVRDGLRNAVAYGAKLTTGRLASVSMELAASHYQPVGYVLAAAKDREDEVMTERERAVQTRLRTQSEEAHARLRSIEADRKQELG